MTACPPITTWAAPAAHTSAVRVEEGSVSCADAGRPQAALVHGRTATVFRLDPASYLLAWSERGVQIGFQTRGFTVAQLTGFAQAAELVPV